VGMVEIAQNGKAHLVPIAIMIDGRFYDAGAYKADPIPMAIQPGTVYEAEQAGASEGLFTVSGALPGKQGWLADGKWRTDAEISAEKARAKAERAKRDQKAPEPDIGDRPRLTRAADSEPAPPAPAARSTTPAPTNTPPDSTNAPPAPANAPPKTSEPPPSTPPAASSPERSDATFENDPNRPVLRRESSGETQATAFEPPAAPDLKKENPAPTATQSPIRLLAAVSDAAGPEPHPYTYDMKPDERQKFQDKMLAMAADEIKARAARLAAESATSKPQKKHAHADVSPQFTNVQFRVFDLSNTNEPVLILTADAKLPGEHGDLQYTTALVTREDIYGDLHKVFAQTTDDQHLDVIPKYELIDVVDANGDGSGDLLFRTTGDNGSAFNIYRVIGDQLWPLFEGKSGS
jgi:hypothetical protein